MNLSPAILIIDMQNDFNDPDTRLFCEKAADLVPQINQLTKTAREHSVPVIWIIQEHRRQLVDFGREGDISPVHCVEGTQGAALINGLIHAPSDFAVIKRRFSGFYATDLELLLRCLQRNTVLLTGIAVDGCVQATGYDAHARDFVVRVIEDGTAGASDEAHQAALIALGKMQPGVVISTGQACLLIAKASST